MPCGALLRLLALTALFSKGSGIELTCVAAEPGTNIVVSTDLTVSVEASPRVHELPADTTVIKYGAVDRCGDSQLAGIIILACPLSINPNDAFYTDSLMKRRVTMLFLDWLNEQRGGVTINGSKYGMRAVFIDDGSSATRITNATAHAIRDYSADFVMAPYSSGLTRYATMQSAADNKLMFAATAAASDVYTAYRDPSSFTPSTTLAPNGPLTFGTLPPATNYMRAGLKSIKSAAEECDASASCRQKCADRISPLNASSCVNSLKVGLVHIDQYFPGVACGESVAQTIGSETNLEFVSNTSVAVANENNTVLGWQEALEKLREQDVSVVVACTYAASALQAVSALQNMSWAPLATMVTVALSTDSWEGTSIDNGWTGEYVVEPVAWHQSLPSFGDFSNMSSDEFYQRFKDRFQAENGGNTDTSVSFIGASQFAALSVLANAIEATNSVDTETVASYLRGSTLSEFFANMTFNADGQAEYDYHVLQYQPFIDPVQVVYGGRKTNDTRMRFPTPSWPVRDCQFHTSSESCSVGNRTLSRSDCECGGYLFGECKDTPSKATAKCECFQGYQLSQTSWSTNGVVSKDGGMYQLCEVPAPSPFPPPPNNDDDPVPATIGGASGGLALILLAAAAWRYSHLQRKALHNDLADAHRDFCRWVNSGGVVTAPPIDSGGFHFFVSHVWSSGQDQARSIKGQLRALVKNLAVFLDVDDLKNIAELETYIARSQVVGVFLSGSIDKDGNERSDYMNSKNCIRELRHAVSLGLPLVFLLETDRMHGGVSLRTHVQQCPPDLREACFGPDAANGRVSVEPVRWYRVKAFQDVSLREIIVRITEAWLVRGLSTCAAIDQGSAKEARDAKAALSRGDHLVRLAQDLSAAPPPEMPADVPFHVYVSRNNPGCEELVALLRDYQATAYAAAASAADTTEACGSLGAPNGAAPGAAPGVCSAGADGQPDADGEPVVDGDPGCGGKPGGCGRPAIGGKTGGDVGRKTGAVCLKTGDAGERKDRRGSSALKARAQRGGLLPPMVPLKVTSDPGSCESAQHVLIYLSRDTYHNSDTDVFEHEVQQLLQQRRAIAKASRRSGLDAPAGVHFVLAFEQREGDDPSAPPPASFEDIFRSTPQELVELGIYDEIAVPITGGAHLAVSLHMLLQNLSGRVDKALRAERTDRSWGIARKHVSTAAAARTTVDAFANSPGRSPGRRFPTSSLLLSSSRRLFQGSGRIKVRSSDATSRARGASGTKAQLPLSESGAAQNPLAATCDTEQVRGPPSPSSPLGPPVAYRNCSSEKTLQESMTLSA